MLVVGGMPDWTPVMGAQVKFRPIDRAMMRRARRAALATLGGSEDADEAERIEGFGDALSYALLVEGIADWRDVAIEVRDGDVTETRELGCTPENVALILSDQFVFDAFDTAYVVPFVSLERERAAPGNGSAASPSGTGVAATQGSDTANSPATSTEVGGVPPARTSSKPRSRTRKRTSGAS